MGMPRRDEAQGRGVVRAVVAAGALAAATLLSLSAPPSFATSRTSPAQLAARVTLRGTVVLTGSRSGVLAVRLPRPVEINLSGGFLLSPPADAEIQGKGPMAGFVLHEDGGLERPTAMSLRVPFCSSPGCTAPWPSGYFNGVFTRSGYQESGSGTLPAGDYHLYLVADGTPTTVTIHLQGLSGRVVLRPPATTNVGFTEVTPSLLASPPVLGPSVWAGGHTYRVTQRWGALIITNMWYLVPLPDEEATETQCEYDNSSPPPLIAYEPPCNIIGEGFTWQSDLALPVGHHYGPLGILGEYGAGMITAVFTPPGTASDGGSSTIAGPVTSFDMQGLIVNF